MFKLFGDGHMGRKAEDLKNFAGMIQSLGMKIPDSMVILHGVFLHIMETSELSAESSCEQLNSLPYPDYLWKINNEILDEMQMGIPYAVRSSALSERGGTGIYHSNFFVPHGNREEDMRLLWEKEQEVYASELSADAKAWRAKNDSMFGMAILIQPVDGFEFEGLWLPALAGTAYTSYQGLPTVRLVIGLGTQAVAGGGLVFNYPDYLKDSLYFMRQLWDIIEAEAINLKNGELVRLKTHLPNLHDQINYLIFPTIFEKLAGLKKHGDFSLEWTQVGKQISIVQCAPYQDSLPGDMTVDADKYFLLANGSDVFNSGRVMCQSLVFVKEWNEAVCKRVEQLNKHMSNYLLIVPQIATSLKSKVFRNSNDERVDIQLAYRHFCNALAVVERQQSYSAEQFAFLSRQGVGVADHTQGEGGAHHFQQLCSRSSILYLGCQFDPAPLLRLDNKLLYEGSDSIQVWDIESVVVVDGVKKEGYVYVAKSAKVRVVSRYSPLQVQKFCSALRQVGGDLIEDEETNDLANAFYCIHYAIAPYDVGPVDFDPFQLNAEDVEEYGLDQIKSSLAQVIENQNLVIPYMLGESITEFSRYLQDLADNLSAQ